MPIGNWQDVSKIFNILNRFLEILLLPLVLYYETKIPEYLIAESPSGFTFLYLMLDIGTHSCPPIEMLPWEYCDASSSGNPIFDIFGLSTKCIGIHNKMISKPFFIIQFKLLIKNKTSNLNFIHSKQLFKSCLIGTYIMMKVNWNAI